MIKGFTLIEVVVAVTIVSFMSMVGISKFGEMQKDTLLTTTVDEFVSDVRTARNKSMSGEISESETPTSFTESGLPVYGISVSGTSYILFREYVKSVAAGGDGVTVLKENMQQKDLGSLFSLSGDSQIKFQRINGKTSGGTFIIERSGVAEKKQVNISSEGILTVIKI